MIQHGDIALRDNRIYGVNGDLAHGEVPEQHIGVIVGANTGNFVKHPTLGANLIELSNGPTDTREIVARVQSVAGIDGWRIDRLSIDVDNSGDVTVAVVEATKVTDNTSGIV